MREHVAVQRVVRHEPVDAAALVFHLAHQLPEAVVLLADEVAAGHAHAVERDLAEVAVGRHVDDRADADAGRVHVDDELGQSGVLRRVRVGPSDQVAPVREGGAARPHLLTVDDPVVAVAYRPRPQRRDVAAGVGLAHADAPHRRAGDDVGEPARSLLGRAELQQRRPHLPVGEPARRDRRAVGDERLVHDEPFERGPAVAALFDRPRHPDPAAGAELLREGGVVADDPRVLGERRPLGPLEPQRGGFARGARRARPELRSPWRPSLGSCVVVIRPVEPHEYDELGALTLDAYVTLDGHIHEPEYEARAGRRPYPRRGDRRRSCSWRLDDDGRMLGGVTHVIDHTSPYAEGTPDDAASHPHARRGVGRRRARAPARRSCARASTRARRGREGGVGPAHHAVDDHRAPAVRRARASTATRNGTGRSCPSCCLLGYRLDLTA